jgi:hypothetical protein
MRFMLHHHGVHIHNLVYCMQAFMSRPNTSSVLWAFCQCWWFKEWSSKEFSLLSSIVAVGTHKMQKDLDMQRLQACTPLFICSFFILARSVLGMLQCSKPCSELSGCMLWLWFWYLGVMRTAMLMTMCFFFCGEGIIIWELSLVFKVKNNCRFST